MSTIEREEYLKKHIGELTNEIIILEDCLVHAKEEKERALRELVEIRANRPVSGIIIGS